jgi:hypothetical protein
MSAPLAGWSSAISSPKTTSRAPALDLATRSNSARTGIPLRRHTARSSRPRLGLPPPANAAKGPFGHCAGDHAVYGAG